MDWLNNDNEETVKIDLTPWKIVIVDDDDEIQKITKLSLKNFIFEGRKLEFISLYSGNAAKEYFNQHQDIALVILDVVMETDDSGLLVANYLRNELKNTFTRIVLRTGQPGLNPAHDIIENYDIDGYIAKTDSNISSLQQLFYIALRSYRDLVRLQSYQKGLEKIIASISNMNQLDDIIELSKGVMSQLACLFNTAQSHFCVSGMNILTRGVADTSRWNIFMNGQEVSFCNEHPDTEKNNAMSKLSEQILLCKHNIVNQQMYGYYYCSKRQTQSVFILKTESELSTTAKRLLELFVTNVVVTMENLVLANTDKG